MQPEQTPIVPTSTKFNLTRFLARTEDVKDFDLLVFNGRFSPWTKAHGFVAKVATQKSKRLLILEGSHLRPPTLRNPLDAETRKRIITAALVEDGIDLERVEFGFIEDFTYRDPLWIEAVQNEVAKHSKPGDKIGLVGYEKDGTSYYLRIFPQWGEHVSVPPQHEGRIISATEVRNDFWDGVLGFKNSGRTKKPYGFFGHPDIHSSTGKILYQMLDDEIMVKLALRREKIRNDNAARQPVGGMTWDIPAATGDAMITCSGHVALGQREDNGLWGFAGGHFDSRRKLIPNKVLHGDTNLLDTSIGEAFEEFGLPTISRDALLRSVVDEKFFDDLHRDERGLYVTRCVHFKLTDRASGLPPLVAGSDIVATRWCPFNEFTSLIATHDHYDMFQVMLGRAAARGF